MAAIVNRSPWLVTAAGQPRRQFPFNERAQAEAFVAALIANGKRATLSQLATAFQVRVPEGMPFDVFDRRHAAELSPES